MPRGIYKHKHHTKSEFKKGHIPSEKTKRKISKKNKRQVAWNKTGSDIKCFICGKTVHRAPSNIREQMVSFCSPKCYGIYISKHKRGENSPAWRGGLTSTNTIIRSSNEYKFWRKSVFERDYYTCLVCGEVGGRLNAHHIKSFKDFPELRFEVSNGITMCVKCHRIGRKEIPLFFLKREAQNQIK